MEKIKVYNSLIFGDIRTTGTTEQPLFCLADVCRAVGLSPKGVNQRLSDEVISNYPIIDSLGREQSALFVNEDGLYDVILDSRKPEAKQFRKWITSEVLPSIRKTGGYIRTEETDDAETILAKAMLVAHETIERQKRQLQAQEPRVIFAKAVETSSRSILIGELAKILNQNGVSIGQNRLFAVLRNRGYLGQRGEYYNIPTQRAMDMGLFEIKKTSILRSDGNSLVSTTTKVTGRGQVYFTNKFLKSQSV